MHFTILKSFGAYSLAVKLVNPVSVGIFKYYIPFKKLVVKGREGYEIE
jgi:hypothetical protein